MRRRLANDAGTELENALEQIGYITRAGWRESSMGKLTTHVLDTANGKPGAGIVIDVAMLQAGEWTALKTVKTNADGRTDAPLLEGASLRAGAYELVFHVGSYFKGRRGSLISCRCAL